MVTTVLLADDHKIVRDGLRSLLEQTPGMEIVSEAENGRDAVELARELKPSIVIMDVGMPELSGVEATQQILSENPEIKIIVLSMHAEKQFVEEMLKAGARGYLLKDAAFEELALALHAVASDKIHVSPAIAEVVVDSFVTKIQGKVNEAPELSGRELAVLQLNAEGKKSKEAASLLHISTKTVEAHRKNIMDKLDIHSVADLTKYAIRHGITSLYP